MTKSIDKLIADHKTMNGLISSLIDYHERLNDFLAPCLKNDYTHNDLISLVLTVKYQQVHTFLVYLDSFNGDLYSKLSLLTSNDDKNTTRLYFIMKSLNNPNYLAHNRKKERERQKIVERIEQVTNNDDKALKRLIQLTKLFVDGQLSYKNMEVCK